MPDNDAGSRLVPVEDFTGVVQAGIRAANHESRQRLWVAYRDDFRVDAIRANPNMMPWDTEQDIKKVPFVAGRQAIINTFNLIADDEERQRVVDAAKRYCEIRSASKQPTKKMNGRQGSLGTITCQRPGCGTTFEPLRKNAKWCSDSCRAMASRARKRITDLSQAQLTATVLSA